MSLHVKRLGQKNRKGWHSNKILVYLKKIGPSKKLMSHYGLNVNSCMNDWIGVSNAQ